MARTLMPDVKQLLKALVNEAILGNTHLAIVNGLKDADPVVLGTASVFFGLTLRAHLEAAQMAFTYVCVLHSLYHFSRWRGRRP